MKKIHFQISTIVLFQLVMACKTIQPTAPVESYNAPTYKPKASDISIPIAIPVNKLNEKINKELKGLIYEDNDFKNNNNDNLKIKVFKQSDIQISTLKDEFKFVIPIKIAAVYNIVLEQFGVKIENEQNLDLALKLKYKSKISIDPSWKVITKTVSDGYEWISSPTTEIAGVSIPLKFIADRALSSQQGTITSLIDEMVGKNIPLKSQMADVWKLIQEPINVSNEPKTWIKITPLEIKMSPLVSENNFIKSFIGLKALTETSLGEKPQSALNTYLPNLQVTSKADDKFNLSITSEITYAYATELAKKQLLNQVFDFKDGKYKIKIDDISLFGSAGKLAIKCIISGSTKGTLFLTAIPYYDALSQSINIKELSYDLDTKNKILKSADWLMHDVFVRKIEKMFTYPIKDNLDESKKLIQKSLTNNQVTPNILLNGKLGGLDLKEICLTPTSMKAFVELFGNLDLKITTLDF